MRHLRLAGKATLKIAESILGTLAEPVLILDGSLRAVLANPSFHALLGVQRHELYGKKLHDLLGPFRAERRLESILQMILAEERDMQDMELALELPQSAPKVLVLTAQRVVFDESPAPLLLLELRDITQEKEVDKHVNALNESLRLHGDELEVINKELESFTHSVSHDLRTPLRLTSKIAHLLLEEDAGQLSDSARAKVRMILDSTEEMGNLIEDLLRFSQLNYEPIRHRRIDMTRLAKVVLCETADAQVGRDVTITVDPAMPVAYADGALLKQVYLNLLVNALKFTRDRKKAVIHVGYGPCDGQMAYHVTDNGVGFDMEQSKSLFLVFQRLHKARGFEGSGIGLALVKRIIERHGGRVWAKGVPEKGAEFYFTLRQQVAG
jgi:PAS domain S-box-containing protein